MGSSRTGFPLVTYLERDLERLLIETGAYNHRGLMTFLLRLLKTLLPSASCPLGTAPGPAKPLSTAHRPSGDPDQPGLID